MVRDIDWLVEPGQDLPPCAGAGEVKEANRQEIHGLTIITFEGILLFTVNEEK